MLARDDGQTSTALANLIRDLVELDPICSVIAIGSMGRGDYHPDSDMDINVVTWRYRETPNQLPWEHSQCMVDWDGVRLDEPPQLGIIAKAPWRFGAASARGRTPTTST